MTGVFGVVLGQILHDVPLSHHRLCALSYRTDRPGGQQGTGSPAVILRAALCCAKIILY